MGKYGKFFMHTQFSGVFDETCSKLLVHEYKDLEIDNES